MNVPWNRVDRWTCLLTPAGPRISSAGSRAAVQRLREGARWAERRADRYALLPGPVQLSEPLVVDRHGLIHALTRTLGQSSSGPTLVGRDSSWGLAEAAVGLSRASGELLTFWWDRGDALRTVLVAPNVWQVATDNRFDRTDFSRLVALRAALWERLLRQVPWVGVHLGQGLGQLPRGSDSFTEAVALLEELIDLSLEDLTPREMPSINWIRQHQGSPSFLHSCLRLPGVDRSRAELDRLRFDARQFLTVLDVRSHPRRLAALLAGPTALPSGPELTDPARWQKRVGVV